MFSMSMLSCECSNPTGVCVAQGMNEYLTVCTDAILQPTVKFSLQFVVPKQQNVPFTLYSDTLASLCSTHVSIFGGIPLNCSGTVVVIVGRGKKGGKQSLFLSCLPEVSCSLPCTPVQKSRITSPLRPVNL